MSFIRNLVLILLLCAIVTPTTLGYVFRDTTYQQTNVSTTVLAEGSLSGYVRDSSLNPIPGALVRVSYHETYQENYSDAAGYYHVTNIPLCYCLKNASCSKQGYKTTWLLLGISENTIYNFTLNSLNLTCYPEIDGVLGPGGYYRSCVNVSFIINGNVDTIFYKIDSNAWNQYTIPFQVSEEGIHILSWYWTYQDYTSSECDITFGIDRTKPTLNVSSERIYISNVEVTAVATDEVSGINRVEFYVDGDLWFIDYMDPYENVVTGFDTHEVKVVAYDSAGNSINDTIVTSYSSQNIPRTLHPLLSGTSIILRFIQQMKLFLSYTITSFLFL